LHSCASDDHSADSRVSTRLSVEGVSTFLSAAAAETAQLRCGAFSALCTDNFNAVIVSTAASQIAYLTGQNKKSQLPPSE